MPPAPSRGGQLGIDALRSNATALLDLKLRSNTWVIGWRADRSAMTTVEQRVP